MPNEINQVGALSKATYNMTCGVVGTKCYLFNGVSGSSDLYTIQIFDTETNQLTTSSTTLNSIRHTTCGAIGTICYLFGGMGSGSASDTIRIFRTSNNGLGNSSAKLSAKAYAIACGVVGTKCYLFGGVTNASTSSFINKIQVYDSETDTISTLATTLPTAAGYITCGVVGTKCYLFGGYYGTGNYLDTIQVFDTQTNTLSTLSATLPAGTYDMACGVIGTKIYLFGGYTANGTLNTIYVFDTQTNILSTLSQGLPSATYGIASGVIDNKIYLLGGAGLATINKFTVNISVPQNNLLLIYDIYSKFKIIDSNKLEFKINPIDCYKGNSNNIGQQVKIALYNETGQDWEEIN